MMDFDELVNRRGSSCAKWDSTQKYAGIDGDDVIPMWIADTDFRAPEVARRALVEMAEFGVCGYMSDVNDMRDAVIWWMKTRHNWEISRDEILCAGGLGNAIALLIDAMTNAGEEIIIFTPVYHEFRNRIENAGRATVEVEMRELEGRMVPDLDAADAAVTDRTRMVLFCSPHNPGGQVWSQDEMQAVADFATRHGLLLVSDEIHHDIVFSGATFTPMAKLDGIEDRLICLTAPSKTFNLAGLRLGHIIIPDPNLRRRMSNHLSKRCIQPNMAGVVACSAVYSPDGAAWADAQNAYLEINRQTFDAGLNAIPGVRSISLEGTFLAWVDFVDTGMNEAEILDRLHNTAKVVPQRGSGFGPGGTGRMRFNIGTQKARIDDAVDRIQETFSDLQ